MTEEVADLIKKAMALPAEARETLVSTLVNSLAESAGGALENGWVGKHRKKAQVGLAKAGRVGYMEVCFGVVGALAHKAQPELVRAAERASIHAFGWPIGVVLHTDEGRPKPLSEGIVAEIHGMESSYDYWALRTNGDFYFLGSLFEDERSKSAIWFDTRIVRTTEALLFCYRLNKALGAGEDAKVSLARRHGGLSGRTLGSAKPGLWPFNRTSHEEQVEWKQTVPLESLRTNLRGTVKAALDPLFVLFDFFQPQDQQVYSEVDTFLNSVSRQQNPFEL